MTLVERLERVADKLEKAIQDKRDENPFTNPMLELRGDGTVKFHFTHPSTGMPERHSSFDMCQVMEIGEALKRLEDLHHMAFA